MRGIKVTLPGVLAVLATAVVLAWPAATPAASASTRPYRGVDVSAYQHPGGAGIDWRRVRRDGYRFVFVKDTEGTYYVNPWFASDVRAASAAGLAVGSYHFANPAVSGGWRQARYMLANGGWRKGMLPPVLDIERNPYGRNACYGLAPARLVLWVRAFERTVHRNIGVWPIINTPAAWWNKCTARSAAFGGRPLWVENSTHNAPRPVLPAGWRTWDYWQYSDTSHVPGIDAVTDLDVRNPAGSA